MSNRLRGVYLYKETLFCTSLYEETLFCTTGRTDLDLEGVGHGEKERVRVRKRGERSGEKVRGTGRLDTKENPS